MAIRRIKIRGTDQRAVLALGALTGVGLVLRGLSPTGSTVTDWIVLLLAGVGAVWASASAPWWALDAVAGFAAALAPLWLPALIGLGVLALSLAIGATRRSQPIERAAVAGGAMLVLSMARELHWFGINSLVGISLVVALAGLGLRRRSRQERRLAFLVVGVAATIAAIGGLGLIAAGSSARPDLSEGNRTARQGLQQLTAGEFELAQQSFQLATAAFARADDDLGAVWAQPARLVPIVSQHRSAGTVLAGAATSATRTIEQQLRLVDLDSLRIVDGRIDVDAVRALEAPMAELQATLEQLDAAVLSARNPWLVGRIDDELDELETEIADQRQLGDKAVAALEVAPAILGAEGERVYFVMFTTPAEARGQGGFMGNWAELAITEGRIEMTAFGRTGELNLGGERPRILTGPDDWLLRWGPFGFRTGADGIVGTEAWSNITISPHFPSTSQVVAELYPQSGGREIDGVISLDVFALEQMVGLVGPLEIDGVDQPLTAENTASFLLVDQYTRPKPDRLDLLDEVARETTDRILAGAVDEPLELGRALGGPARSGRLLAWSADVAEQQVVRNAGIDGSLSYLSTGSGAPTADQAEVLSLRTVNAGGNKIDTYLERRVCIVADDAGRWVRAHVELVNRAPAGGLPDVVIGNLVDLPMGFNKSYVTWHSTVPVVAATLGGRPLDLLESAEAGLPNYSAMIEIPPAGTSELVLTFADQFAEVASDEPPGFWVSPQPLVAPESWATASAPAERCDAASFQPIETPTSLSFP